MTSSRKYVSSSAVSSGAIEQSGRAVLRLQARGGSDRVTLTELPIAVGFGSPFEVYPRRLRAVPGLPTQFVGPAAAGPTGRVLWLPLGDVDRSKADALAGPSFDALNTAVLGSEPAPLRLTARGRAVLLLVAAAIGLAVIVAAWFGAGSPAGPAPSARPAQVVVHDGDTLWSIASRIAPDRDPRAIVDQLLRINRLDTPSLVPGQVLRTH